MAADGFTRTKGYPVEGSKYDYYCENDGFEGGKDTIVNVDEYKLLKNLVLQVPCDYAEDCQTISGDGTPTDF